MRTTITMMLTITWQRRQRQYQIWRQRQQRQQQQEDDKNNDEDDKANNERTTHTLLPKNESVLLFWESDGGTKTGADFWLRAKEFTYLHYLLSISMSSKI